MRPVGSTLTRPRSGEPDGPDGMNRPSSARRIWSISPAVSASRGTTSVAANRRIVRDDGIVGESADRRCVPAGFLQRRHQFAGGRLGGVHRGPVVVAVLGEAERLAQPRHGLVTAEQLPCPQNGQDQIEFAIPRRLLAQDVQTVADLDILDLAQPTVDMQQHVIERVVLGPLVQTEIVVHLRRPHQRPDLLTDRG